MSIINIVTPFDESIHSIVDLNNTLASIPKSEYIKSIVITKTDLSININYIKADFTNIFSAYNKATAKIKQGYVLYLVPGDIINVSDYNLLSLINENYNIIQFNHDRKKPNGEIYHLNKLDSYDTVFDGETILPNNLSCVYDKLYKVEFLKNNGIKFKNHINSSDIFNYTCLSKASFLYKNIIILTHKIGCNIGVLNNTAQSENILIKEILNTNKDLLKKTLQGIYKKNQDIIYYGAIDFVFPYVTSDDKVWQDLYKKALTGTETDWAAGIERFRDSGMLKYVFRSIETHMPWINKVHMIVMSDSQVPKWINRKNVDIITHDEFIPKELLPTFNSCTIDMFLSKLPRVSNNIIFSNDDLITFKDLSPTYFFEGPNPSYNINLRNYKKTAPGDITRLNVYNLIMGKDQNNRVVTTQHGTISYRMDWLKECYSKYEDKILKSCSKFREHKNYNQYLYAFYQMFEKTICNTSKDIISYTVKNAQVNKILKDDFTSHDFICINDDNSALKESWDEIIEKIDKLLPAKSKYEV